MQNKFIESTKKTFYFDFENDVQKTDLLPKKNGK